MRFQMTIWACNLWELVHYEVPLEKLEENAPLVLEIDLMFADLTRHGGADSFGENPDVDSTELLTQMYRSSPCAFQNRFCRIVD